MDRTALLDRFRTGYRRRRRRPGRRHARRARSAAARRLDRPPDRPSPRRQRGDRLHPAAPADRRGQPDDHRVRRGGVRPAAPLRPPDRTVPRRPRRGACRQPPAARVTDRRGVAAHRHPLGLGRLLRGRMAAHLRRPLARPRRPDPPRPPRRGVGSRARTREAGRIRDHRDPASATSVRSPERRVGPMARPTPSVRARLRPGRVPHAPSRTRAPRHPVSLS